MTEAERIREVLYRFEDAGLVSKDLNKALDCVSDSILGIGIGEQGIVKSKEDIRRVFTESQKGETTISHSVSYGEIEIAFHTQSYASLCTEVIVTSHPVDGSRQQESRFFQMLSLHKQEGEWKICALHASTPVISEENIEAYPLKIAEKTLESLRKKIGEEVYLAEEQYRRAILSDTIAFYIINITQDTFEKCQLNDEMCAYVEPGTSLNQFVRGNASQYVAEEDIEQFLATFSAENIDQASRNGIASLSCEYRLRLKNGGYTWVISIIRLITDAETGERKGIMYVRDISKMKQEKTELLDKASRDSMTQLYNKETLSRAVDQLLSDTPDEEGIMIMLDVDNFKFINDTYGHPTGDKVLIRLAQAIKKSFSEQAWTGRAGGDEFCVFIPYAERKKLWERELQCLWKAIAAIRLSDCPELHITCSIGVANRRPGPMRFRELYENADRALYFSKNNGKGKISYYDDIRPE